MFFIIDTNNILYSVQFALLFHIFIFSYLFCSPISELNIHFHFYFLLVSTLNNTVKVHEANIVKIVWVPPEYGDAVACISVDGIVSLLEDVVEGIVD